MKRQASTEVILSRAALRKLIRRMRDEAENLNPSGGWPGSAFTKAADELSAILKAGKSPPDLPLQEGKQP